MDPHRAQEPFDAEPLLLPVPVPHPADPSHRARQAGHLVRWPRPATEGTEHEMSRPFYPCRFYDLDNIISATASAFFLRSDELNNVT